MLINTLDKHLGPSPRMPAAHRAPAQHDSAAPANARRSRSEGADDQRESFHKSLRSAADKAAEKRSAEKHDAAAARDDSDITAAQAPVEDETAPAAEDTATSEELHEEQGAGEPAIDETSSEQAAADAAGEPAQATPGVTSQVAEGDHVPSRIGSSSPTAAPGAAGDDGVAPGSTSMADAVPATPANGSVQTEGRQPAETTPGSGAGAPAGSSGSPAATAAALQTAATTKEPAAPAEQKGGQAGVPSGAMTASSSGPVAPAVPPSGDVKATVANTPAHTTADTTAGRETTKPPSEVRSVTAMEPAALEKITEALRPNEPASVLRSADPVAAPAGEGRTTPQAMTPMRLMTDSAGGSPLPPAPLPEQNVEAVVASVRSGIAGGKQHHSMTIRLDPPQLGSMRVNVQMVDGQLVASFNTTSEVAQRLVQQSLPQLRLGLEQAGFQIDRLEVSRTHSDSQSNLFQQGGDGESREQMQQHQRQQHRRETLIRLWRNGWFDDSVNLVA